MPGPTERRQTTSFQLNQGLHRAVQETDASISDLAEEGVVHGVADELNGLCWLCGNYISRNSGSEVIDAGEMNDRSSTAVFGETDRWKFGATDEIPADERFEHIAGRMMLPDEVVELCHSCSRLVDEKAFWSASDFHTAYYGRGMDPEQKSDRSDRIRNVAPKFYAAEVAAVTLASPTSLYQQKPEAAFWWSIHPAVRRRILTNAEKDVSMGIESEHRPWYYIGLYNNAYWWAWDRPAAPVFEMAISANGGSRVGVAPNRKAATPGGSRRSSAGYRLSNNECPACSAPHYDEICDRCFYIGDAYCEQCSGKLEMSIEGEVRRECQDCGWHDTPSYFEGDFAETYADVLMDIRRYIPAECRQDIGRLVDKKRT